MEDVIRYKVLVMATVERTERIGNDWKIIGQEPIVEGSDKPKDIYGYTPIIEKTMQREISVYEQSVDDLDLAKLVSVVNGISVQEK